MPRWWAWVALSAILACVQFGHGAITRLTQTPEQRRAEEAREVRQQKRAEELMQMPKDTQRVFDDIDNASRPR